MGSTESKQSRVRLGPWWACLMGETGLLGAAAGGLAASAVDAGLSRQPCRGPWAEIETGRSKAGGWASGAAARLAWLLGLPPVERGQAAAGDAPGLGATVGTLVTDGLGRVEAVASEVGAVVGVIEREADVAGAGVGEPCVCGSGPHALTTTMPMARASAP